MEMHVDTALLPGAYGVSRGISPIDTNKTTTKGFDDPPQWSYWYRWCARSESEDELLSVGLGSPEQIERGAAIDAAGDIRQFDRDRVARPRQYHVYREFDECCERLAL